MPTPWLLWMVAATGGAVATIVALLGCSFWKKKRALGEAAGGCAGDITWTAVSDKSQLNSHHNHSNNLVSHGAHAATEDVQRCEDQSSASALSPTSLVTKPSSAHHAQQDVNRSATLNRELPRIPGGDASATCRHDSQLYAVVADADIPSSSVQTMAVAGGDSAARALTTQTSPDEQDSLYDTYQTVLSGSSTNIHNRSFCREEVCNNSNMISNDSRETIRARLAVSGSVPASAELPYMTPPPAPAGCASVNTAEPTAASAAAVRSAVAPSTGAGLYFSGDSVQSADSRGYTRITVREPVAELCLQSSCSHTSPPRTAGASVHQVPLSCTAALSASPSSTATVAAAAAVTDTADASGRTARNGQIDDARRSSQLTANLYCTLDETRRSSTVNNNIDDYDGDEDEDALYEAIVDGQRLTARRISTASGRSPTPSGMAAGSTVDAAASVSTTGTSSLSTQPTSVAHPRTATRSLHCRQGSNSGVVATAANVGSPVVERRAARSPLPPLPSADQLELMYAKVHKSTTTTAAAGVAGHSAVAESETPPVPPPPSIDSRRLINNPSMNAEAFPDNVASITCRTDTQSVSQQSRTTPTSTASSAITEPNYECIDRGGGGGRACAVKLRYNAAEYDYDYEDEEEDLSGSGSACGRYARIRRHALSRTSPADAATTRGRPAAAAAGTAPAAASASRHLYERVRRDASTSVVYEPPYECIAAAGAGAVIDVSGDRVDPDAGSSSGSGYARLRPLSEPPSRPAAATDFAGAGGGGGSDTEELYSSIAEPPYAAVHKPRAPSLGRPVAVDADRRVDVRRNGDGRGSLRMHEENVFYL